MISGRSSISTLPGINPRPAFLEPRLAYLRPCLRRRGKTQKIAPTGNIQRMVDRAAKRAEGKGQNSFSPLW